MNKLNSGVYAAGDNSFGQLWNSKFKLSPRFIKCETFPINYSAITSFSAWNQSIAIVEQGSKIHFKQGDNNMEIYKVGLIRQIFCLEDSAIAFLSDNSLIEIPSMKRLNAHKCKAVSCSPNIICYIDSNNNAYVILGNRFSKPVEVAKDVDVIGCTLDTVFIVQKDKLFKIEFNENEIEIENENESSESENDENTNKKRDDENGKLKIIPKMIQIKTNATIAAIYCSEDDALFIDTEGGLHHYAFTATIQVFGLPQVISCAVGPQHFAALSVDGRLFCWGFNPSGQLGIGNDRPTNEPTFVLDGVAAVTCGTHHTLALRTFQPPEVPPLIDSSKLKRIPSAIPQSKGRITRAELLT
ncbi:hypothetical protein TRFO_06201 [Tritrichomonas foetus]|uniref:Uncharacterized protein n=1 Tax=Tritrichomonas foetus TaxID=1144522 RepID=A0A1J4K015_9EUKA|nr:hypothetical protein TRFO_06201 [Tritrichomonas foetus]|eukprot:OHT04759.1 hypothetical protein TRFO_06201 [Tritrichomonas foetus]